MSLPTPPSAPPTTAIAALNTMPDDRFRDLAISVCSTATYATHLLQARPFTTVQALHDASRSVITHKLSQDQLLEALAAHPRIGATLRRDDASDRAQGWSRAEQSGVDGVQQRVKQELERLNQVYFERFGFVFLICATGKSGEEMLDSLKRRIGHGREEELGIARAEKADIAQIRWGKVLSELEDGG